MTASKHRVYIAVYLQPGLAEQYRDQFGLSFYRWAIWIEPKGAKDTTSSHCFDVVAEDFLDSWQFRHDDSAQPIRSPGLVVRVMVGKLPQQACVYSDVFPLLHEIPLPNPNSDYVEDSLSWTAEALLMLQEHGMIETFDVAAVMQSAATAAESIQTGPVPVGGKRLNAVLNRKFP